MGITGLAAALKKCAGPKKDVSCIASEFPGGVVVGLDVSCKLVPWVRSVRGAEEYHSDPRLPASHVAHQCLSYIRRLQRKNIRVIAVFDGVSRHPLKASVAGEKRDNPSDTALSLLKRLLRTPWPSDEKKKQFQILSSITSSRRASAKVDTITVVEVARVLKLDGIKCIFAPFEADWQLAYMYNIGVIHAIDTTESDY